MAGKAKVMSYGQKGKSTKAAGVYKGGYMKGSSDKGVYTGLFKGSMAMGGYNDGVIGKGMAYLNAKGGACCGGSTGDLNNPDELQKY